MSPEFQQKTVDLIMHILLAIPENERAEVVSALPLSPPPPPGDMALAPRDDTKRSFADPLLPREMVAAGEDVIDKAHEDLQNYVSGKTIDWDSGMIAVAVYRAMVEWWCRSDAEDVAEALQDAICDGDGQPRPDALQHHLAKRGLKIVRNGPLR